MSNSQDIKGEYMTLLELIDQTDSSHTSGKLMTDTAELRLKLKEYFK